MSERFERIRKLLKNQKSRASYIKAKLVVLVPAQIRALRLKSTDPSMPYQRDLAREAEMQQSRISMFETPGEANITLETLAKIAAGLRVGVIVKFVPFHEMLQWENSFSPDDFNVKPRLEEDDEFINPHAVGSENQPSLAELLRDDRNEAASQVTPDSEIAETRKPVARADAKAASAGIGGR